jgi:hypothetical protein
MAHLALTSIRLLQSAHIPHIPHIPPAPILFILSCTGHSVLALLVSAMGICWGKGHILSQMAGERPLGPDV